MSVDIVQHFIGTNNSFAIEEVIKPFLKDVYGADFDLDMSTDYSAKVDTFQEAIEKYGMKVSSVHIEIIKGTLFLIWLKKL